MSGTLLAYGPDGFRESASATAWRPPAAFPRGSVAKAPDSKVGFYLVVLYMLFEFGRPQDILPGIKGIPFGTGISALILLKVLQSGKLNFSRLQTRLWIPLFVVMAIHVPLAVNNFWALMTFKDMFLLFCVYLGVITFVDTVGKMMTLMKFWMAIHVLLAAMGIAKGGIGIGAWMADENDFCMVMNMAAPFGYFLMFSANNMAQKLKYLGCLGAFLLAAMASLSRGGFIGLASVGSYCWYRSPKKMNALVVLLVAIVFMVLLAPETYWDEIASSTSDETIDKGTGAERLYTWGIGMEMFLHNPIIGIGQSNFPWTFDSYQEGRTFQGRSIAGRQAHSAWVTLIAELGIAGIVIIGMMLLQCYRDLKLVRTRFAPPNSRLKHGVTVHPGEDVRVYFARAMEGSLIGFIVSGVFISILWYPSLWIMMSFVVALRNIADNDQGAQVAPPDPVPVSRRLPFLTTARG
ncbi:putative O-antigen polymerase [Nitrospira japonica]|uniref:Putative O-antigen polymerase n=2 Tax=Nitrospira japonica TaxID=1325564 RepID=A0A1W1IB17_9BACT|nr:putative O-antigen polymerase [Nitrospira japonica]